MKTDIQQDKQPKGRVYFFFLGVLMVLAVFLLMGADAPAPSYGRYQISAWGDSTAHGAFIVDTTSGETKIVYRYKEENGGQKVRDHLNKSFHSIP
jgi:hypothetical protein